MEKADISLHGGATESCMEIHYDLRYEEVKDGLRQFYRKKQRKKSIFYTILCGAVLLINLVDILWRGNTHPTVCLFIVFCCAIIVFTWYFPVRHREKMARIIHENPMQFSMKVYDTCLSVENEKGERTIPFLDSNLEILEDQEKFLLFASKEEIYILPKRCIQEIEKLKKKFEILGKRFQKVGGKNE